MTDGEDILTIHYLPGFLLRFLFGDKPSPSLMTIVFYLEDDLHAARVLRYVFVVVDIEWCYCYSFIHAPRVTQFSPFRTLRALYDDEGSIIDLYYSIPTGTFSIFCIIYVQYYSIENRRLPIPLTLFGVLLPSSDDTHTHRVCVLLLFSSACILIMIFVLLFFLL